VLLIAAEGADEVRLRLDAVVRNKCGNMERVPFRWYETTPMLLQKGALETLVAMAQQADRSLRQEFGLPLGLVVIDTIAACAGYPRAGDENDSAAAQTVMNVLKAIAETLGCFVLGVDHFGKDANAVPLPTPIDYSRVRQVLAIKIVVTLAAWALPALKNGSRK
jgi:hypothetical protein